MSVDRQAVKQLDHIIVRADDPQPLFKLLSETLQLFIKVSSLKKAETFLTETGMLGALEEGQVTIAPEKICGLDVRLVE
ncbi:MAG: hypothetical protein QOJ02_2230 [Acidobacteriota bacterium]|jgi:hypothetical protein|nr:hypothetical protein [Acidobacteriota bacterium]